MIFNILKKKKMVYDIYNNLGAAGLEYWRAVHERYNNDNEGRNKQGLDGGEEQIW